MTALAVVGCSILGAGIGFMAGVSYGFKVDKSDLPIYPAVSGPIGAVVGAIVGTGIGTALLT